MHLTNNTTLNTVQITEQPYKKLVIARHCSTTLRSLIVMLKTNLNPKCIPISGNTIPKYPNAQGHNMAVNPFFGINFVGSVRDQNKTKKQDLQFLQLHYYFLSP